MQFLWCFCYGSFINGAFTSGGGGSGMVEVREKRNWEQRDEKSNETMMTRESGRLKVREEDGEWGESNMER